MTLKFVKCSILKKKKENYTLIKKISMAESSFPSLQLVGKYISIKSYLGS